MLSKSIKRLKCNNCGSISEVVISVKKQKNTTKINLCKECLTELYFDISKVITPKSPRNILNKFN